MSINDIAKSLAINKGHDAFYSDGNNSDRIIYPAIVVNTNDQAGFNRIQARIVNLDKSGKVIDGKDRLISDSDLPICIPMLTEIVHVRPKIGEMVLIIAENPSDITSPRFYLGPIITSQTKLPLQEFRESINIFNTASFRHQAIFDGPTLQNQAKQAAVLPRQTDIAVQGREDADILFRQREIELRVGKFMKNSNTELNANTPCRINLRQIDTSPNLTGLANVDRELNKSFIPYSQMNIVATNINLISNEGKYRAFNNNTAENKTYPRVKDYGDLATQLHPAVFGDELLILLKLILQFLLSHQHTPQNPPVTNSIYQELESYLNSGKLQDLISNVVRLC